MCIWKLVQPIRFLFQMMHQLLVAGMAISFEQTGFLGLDLLALKDQHCRKEEHQFCQWDELKKHSKSIKSLQ